MAEYWLFIDLRGNTRFPEAFEVRCVVEWDARRPLEELRQMASEFYGVPLKQVGSLRETPLSRRGQGRAYAPSRGRSV